MRATLCGLLLYLRIAAATTPHVGDAGGVRHKPTPGWTAYYDIDNPKDNPNHNDVDCFLTCQSSLLADGEVCRDYMSRVYIDTDGNALKAQCITIIDGDVVDYKEAGQEEAVRCEPCLNWQKCEEHDGPYMKNCQAHDAAAQT